MDGLPAEALSVVTGIASLLHFLTFLMIFHISSLASVMEVQPQNSGCCWREIGFPSNIKWALAHCFPFHPWERPHQLVQIYAVSPWGKEQHWQNPLILPNNSNLLFFASNRVMKSPFRNPGLLTISISIWPNEHSPHFSMFSLTMAQGAGTASLLLLAPVCTNVYLPITGCPGEWPSSWSFDISYGSHNFHRGTFNHGCMVN